MKQLLTALFICLSVIGLFSFAVVKKYQLEESQAVMIWNMAEGIKKMAPVSEAVTAKEASTLLQYADSVQKVLYKQAQDTTHK